MAQSESIRVLVEDTFTSEIQSGVTLVDFFAEWCAPCKMLTPILEEVAREMQGDASIAKVDIDNAQNIAANYNITSVPTLILFKDGKEMNRVVGVKDKDALKELIRSAL